MATLMWNRHVVVADEKSQHLLWSLIPLNYYCLVELVLDLLIPADVSVSVNVVVD